MLQKLKMILLIVPITFSFTFFGTVQVAHSAEDHNSSRSNVSSKKAPRSKDTKRVNTAKDKKEKSSAKDKKGKSSGIAIKEEGVNKK